MISVVFFKEEVRKNISLVIKGSNYKINNCENDFDLFAFVVWGGGVVQNKKTQYDFLWKKK